MSLWLNRVESQTRRYSFGSLRRRRYAMQRAKLTVCNQPESGYSTRSFLLKFNQIKFMSQHRSLRAASTLGGKRNVLKRFERTALLEKRGQRKAGDRITGLRKTKPEA